MTYSHSVSSLQTRSPIPAKLTNHTTAPAAAAAPGYPQREPHALEDEHDSHLLQQRHTQQYRNAARERAEATRVAKRVDGRVNQSDEQQRQRGRDGEQDPLLARFGVGAGRGEEGRECEDGDEGGDEEGEADFGQGLGFVAAGGAVVVARVDAADDAEDDADGVEDLGELDVAGRDGRLVRLVDVGLDPAEEAAREFQVSTFSLER